MANPRTTTLTPAVQAHVAERVRSGVAPDHAIEELGIHRRYHWEWLSRGREGVEPFAAYAVAVMQARAYAAAEASVAIQRAIVCPDGPSRADRDWRAATEYLKRREAALWDPPRELGQRTDMGDMPPEDRVVRRRRLQAMLRALDDDDNNETKGDE